MTEAEWLAAIDPTPMLEFLRGKASDRKLRLFMVACARLLWERVPPGEMREAVEAAERCADGTPREDELAGYCHRLYSMFGDYRRETGRDWGKDHTREDAGVYFTVLYTTGAGIGVQTIVPMLPRSGGGLFIMPLTGARQPNLLRCIFGNPFRPMTPHPNWLTPASVVLARAMYEERAFDRMPALAGELERAGCSDQEILAHCRGDGPHVRGCWVVDLILGKT